MYRLETLVYDGAMVAISLWIIFRIWGSFYEERKRGVNFYLFVAAFAMVQMGFQLNLGHVQLLLSVLNVVTMLGIGITGYESRGKYKYFLLLLLWTGCVLIELITLFMIRDLNLSDRAFGILGEVISKLLMMGIVYGLTIVNFKKRQGMIPNKLYGWLFFIPIGSIYIAIHEFFIGRKPIFSMLVVSILLVINVIIYELYIRMCGFFFEQREYAMYVQQTEMIENNTSEQTRMLEEFREEKHNLVNELVVLKELIQSGDTGEAVDNIDRIINGQYEMKRIADTGNNTVDAIINFKYAVASEYNITFRLKAFIPQELPVMQKDIGVVLGNALDNAIEATRDCVEHERSIEILMGVKKEAFIMVIRNPFEKKIMKNSAGEIVTDKEDGTRHGFGLKSIRKVAQSYQGDAIVDATDHEFSLTVVLNLPEI